MGIYSIICNTYVQNTLLSRYIKFSSSDRKCEKAFNEYLKDKMSRAKNAFKELLQETKKITDKSLSMVKEKDSGHMSEIVELLSKDKRYLDLESVEGKYF